MLQPWNGFSGWTIEKKGAREGIGAEVMQIELDGSE